MFYKFARAIISGTKIVEKLLDKFYHLSFLHPSALPVYRAKILAKGIEKKKITWKLGFIQLIDPPPPWSCVGVNSSPCCVARSIPVARLLPLSWLCDINCDWLCVAANNGVMAIFCLCQEKFTWYSWEEEIGIICNWTTVDNHVGHWRRF